MLLSYCTNVHPGVELARIRDNLQSRVARVRREAGFSRLATGLWLPAEAVSQLLADRRTLEEFRGDLDELGLSAITLNAFPYGSFHTRRVKEGVYRPSWAEEERLDYTVDAARVLAALLPEEVEEGTISTLAGGFKPSMGQMAGEPTDPEPWREAARNYGRLAGRLTKLVDETGRRIRVCVEPEPWTMLERAGDIVRFWELLRGIGAEAAEEEGAVEGPKAISDHLGLCWDTCHQAVEFETAGEVLRAVQEAGVRIGKVQISSAIERPPDVPPERLMPFDEGRYLHQIVARAPDGSLSHIRDLETVFEADAELPAELREATWRVHFHVPIFLETIGPLPTTRPDLIRALSLIKHLDPLPHLEVETYTWHVIPEKEAERLNLDTTDLVPGIARELQWAREQLD